MTQLLKRGVFLLSIDTEMAWGVVHRGDITGNYTYRSEREVIERLLQLFEKYDIAATFAIVGHLFLDRCKPVNGRKHPEIVRPPYSWFNGDWFDVDPCGDVDSDPIWYGRDIVERIRRCRVPQEIGSHAFSHIIVGDPECSEESFDSELRMCHQLAGQQGLTLKSFVYPRNSVGHLDVLARNGFTAYRGRTPAPFANLPKHLRAAAIMADKLSPLSGSAVFPESNAGMWNFPPTNFYSPMTQRMRLLPVSLWPHLVGRRLRQAIRERSLFHIWFHSHDLAIDPDKTLRGLELLFQRVNRYRDAGVLENLTMGDLATTLRKEAQLVA